MPINHIKSHPDKSLYDHLMNVTRIAQKNMPVGFEHLKETLEFTTKLHDIGKATDFFQKYLFSKDEKERIKLKKQKETNHAKFSAIISFSTLLASADIDFANFKIDFSGKLWKNSLMSYLSILRHHGDLKKPDFNFSEEDLAVFFKQLESISPEILSEFGNALSINLNYQTIRFFLEKLPNIGRKVRSFFRTMDEYKYPDLFIELSLLYSLLIDADKLDAGISFENLPPKPDFNRPDLICNYKKIKKWDVITDGVNGLRNQVYSEVMNNLKEITKPGIYSLNVPTGLGKTLTSFSLALKLRDKVYKQHNYYPRIIYSLPFTSIIEQNFKALQDTGIDDDSSILLKHHYLSEITYYQKDDEYDYETSEAQLLIESWNSEIIISTFVQLFHALIGYKNRMMKKYNKIPSSILILDEIQAIPIRYWKLINEIFLYLTQNTNTYIFMVTASKPSMVEITKSLVDKPDYYFEKMSRCRIKYFKKSINLDNLLTRIEQELDKNHSILVVVNTISCSINIFDALVKQKRDDVKYIYLSTNIVPYERLKRIGKIKENGQKVVISTQMVEAGVDIDLDVVFRDIAPFDSIMQSAGRCNRNFNNKEGMVYILNFEGGKYSKQIYDPILIQETERILQENPEFSEAKFLHLAEEYFNNLKPRIVQNSEYLTSIHGLDYDDHPKYAIDKFKLIEEGYPKVDIFVEINNNAKQIFSKYQEIKNHTQDRFERKKAFNKIKSEFTQFVMSVGKSVVIKNQPPDSNGFTRIPFEQLREFYNEETGFKREGEAVFW